MPVASCEEAGSSTIGGTAVKSAEAFDDVPADFELPAGSVKKGEKLFKKYCSQCHSIYPDNRITRAGQTQLGPTLFNIYGRASGMEEIQNKLANERVDGVLWLEAPLMNYMKNPRVLAQGRVQMNFRGIPDFQTRVDIVHYMKTLDWSNEELANPPERPSSLAPVRWLQMYQKASGDAATQQDFPSSST
jgi:cytochrome c